MRAQVGGGPEGEREVQEDCPLNGEPDAGLDPMTLRSCDPCRDQELVAQPTEPPRHPSLILDVTNHRAASSGI